MTIRQASNPADEAAREALEKLSECVKQSKSFVFEAGAGAGKTYSLGRSLKQLIEEQGSTLSRRNQQIACITYTNVAKNEIRSKTDNHPVVLAETIHSFCWSLLRSYQVKLRAVLPSIERWAERIAEQGEIGTKPIEYTLGYPKVEGQQVTISHDDVISLMVKFMEEAKFRLLFTKRYPVLFIDEYQDTSKIFTDALLKYFVGTDEGPLIGFFGDPWQTIYEKGSCGKVEHPNLISIGKKANFRSDRKIVEMLNRMRIELPQNVQDLNSEGSIAVYHTNAWRGERLSSGRGGQWNGDLPPELSHQYLERVRKRLLNDGWDFQPDKTKTLMLTHQVLASEQGYPNLAKVFKRSEDYIKKENDHIAFLVNVLEPVCTAYEHGRYGEMFAALGKSTPKIRNHADKVAWANDMNALLEIRQTGTIGQVIEHLKTTRRPRLSERVERQEKKYSVLGNASAAEQAEQTEKEKSFLERLQNLKAVQYQEVIALAQFIENKTPFATKHSVKGAEFENVVVVCGRGWNLYNFNQMLEWVQQGVPAGKQHTFERNRNLFYVACSRPMKRLAVLFTQELSETALETLAGWFGADAIHALPDLSQAE